MNYVKILICFIGILFISLVLFWVSPLSEFDTLTCYGLYDQNAQYIEGSGSCGISVGGLHYINPIFLLHTKKSNFIDLCRRNIQTVESVCNIKIQDAIALKTNTAEVDRCIYFIDKKSGYIGIDVLHSLPLTEDNSSDIIYFKSQPIIIFSPSFDYRHLCPQLKDKIK